MSILSRLERIRDKDATLNQKPSDEPNGNNEPAASAPANGGVGGVAGSSYSGASTVEDDSDALMGVAADLIPLSDPLLMQEGETIVRPALGSNPPPRDNSLALTDTDDSLDPAFAGDDLRRYFRHKHLIFDEVLGSLDPRLWQQPQRDAIRDAVSKAVADAVRSQGLAPDPAEIGWLVREFTQEITDFGPITQYLDDPAIGKININGANEVSVDRLGQTELLPVSFRDDDHLLSLIRRVADIVGNRIDSKVPLLDRPLPDGSRIRAKVPPISPHPTLTIEKTSGNPFEAVKRQQADRQRTDTQPFAQLRDRIQQRLVRELDSNALSNNPDQLRTQVEAQINNVLQEERVAMTRAERASLVTELLHEIIGLGPIEPLLNDPDIDEVMVNGPYQVYAERKGKLELTRQRFRDNAHVMQVIERIVAPLGRRVDEKSPMVDGRLRDGSRFNAVIPPLSLVGPTITIRKFARDPYTMTDLINFGTITREAAQFLQAAVEARLNIVISGGTGSGKTTTLNVLSGFIPADERIVTIEDAAELQMRQEHVVRLETRPANIEGVGEVTIRDLVRNALRMRPDRIVIGECRGAEALDMLQAMNTGHDGSLTTGHSNNPREMLKRFETMVLMAGFDLPVRAIREQLALALDVVVHQERMRDGTRRVVAITEIVGMEGDVITLQDIFTFEQYSVDEHGKINGRLQPNGLRPKFYTKMLEAGVKLPMNIFTPRAVEGSQAQLDRAS
ncbi:MAG: CpaF family protein [Abitibacteriaceae bacterium]|nr:CpaF family protein [Abditibacteriaceae bacterium]